MGLTQSKGAKGTRAARVRAAAKRLKTFSPIMLINEIAVDTREEARKVRMTIYELFKRGELTHIAQGKYEYIDGNHPAVCVRQRIFRAIYIKGLFCIGDIFIRTDAEVSYIRATVRRLIQAGDIEHIGTHSSKKQYWVKNSDKFYLKYIKNDTKTD